MGRGVTFKDWFSTILSGLAFLISAGTAYYTTVRRSDDLRVIVTGYPMVRWDAAASTLEVDPRHTLVVLNQGNQPVAIVKEQLSIYFDVGRGNTAESDVPCRGDLVGIVNTDLGPSAFKEQDASVHTVGLKEILKKGRPGENGEAVFDVEKKKYLVARVCISFVISSPSRHYDVIEVGLFENQFKADMSELGPGRLRPDRAIQVVKGTGTIFDP